MNKRGFIKKIIKEEFNRTLKESLYINEDIYNGKTILNVDIQPEYKSSITFNLNKWGGFLNENLNNNRIVFLYNGADTLGMISKNDYINWLFEEVGVSEELIEMSEFYDKGYAFFRYCIDSSIDQDNIVDLVKYMLNNNINDSRDINAEMWNDFMKDTGHNKEEIRELLENSGDMINIPDLMDFLKDYNNIVLTGGGINECLKEVEIALMALDKPFNILSEYTY